MNVSQRPRSWQVFAFWIGYLALVASCVGVLTSCKGGNEITGPGPTPVPATPTPRPVVTPPPGCTAQMTGIDGPPGYGFVCVSSCDPSMVVTCP